MKSDELFPKLLNYVTIDLEDGVRYGYAVNDDCLMELLETLGKWQSYPPIGAIRNGPVGIMKGDVSRTDKEG